MSERLYVGEDEVIKKNMELAKRRDYTISCIEELPEGERAELIDGQMFLMASPTRTHQRLQMFLSGSIWAYIREKKGTCQVYTAPFGVYLNNDEYTYLEPDVVVVCDEEKLDEKGCHGAPDFVAEVISPSTRSRDYLLKLNKYQAAGVREYWILDRSRDLIQVYDFENKEVWGYGLKEKVAVRIFGDLEIDFSEF